MILKLTLLFISIFMVYVGLKMPNKKQSNIIDAEWEEWGTPNDLYEELNKKFNFTLDPCATHDNAKCNNFYTLEEDGLSKDWGGNTVFVNPPYTRGAIGKWIKKAEEESKKPNTTVVCLIPSRTDTKYWHEHCMNAAHIYFIKGRLKFQGEANNSAPFPSVLVVFSSDLKKYETITATSSVSKKGIRL